MTSGFSVSGGSGGVNIIRLPRRIKSIRAKGRKSSRMLGQAKVPGTFDQLHKLPPDKITKLTSTVFTKWNQTFKVIAVKRQLNGQYNVGVELNSGTHKLVVV